MTRESISKGWRREKKTMAILEGEGFTCTRAGGSKGCADIVAWNGERIRFIQVKSNRLLSPAERQRFRDLVVPPNASKEVWVWPDHARRPRLMEVDEMD